MVEEEEVMECLLLHLLAAEGVKVTLCRPHCHCERNDDKSNAHYHATCRLTCVGVCVCVCFYLHLELSVVTRRICLYQVFIFKTAAGTAASLLHFTRLWQTWIQNRNHSVRKMLM